MPVVNREFRTSREGRYSCESHFMFWSLDCFSQPGRANRRTSKQIAVNEQGTWQLVSETMEGKEQPAEYTRQIQITFDAQGNWHVDKGTEALSRHQQD